MILFDLLCGKEHAFEGWFRDNATYEAQEAAGEIVCPICGDTKVRKAVMAPRIGKGAGRGGSAAVERGAAESAAPGATEGESPKALARRAAEQRALEIRAALLELRKKVEETCDYVGPRFPEEARRIHYGETERRNIYGEASKEEAHAMAEEGIEFGAIPWLPRTDA